MAGNMTRGAIALGAEPPRPQKIREGKPALSDFPRFAWATPSLSDLATFRLAPLRMAAQCQQPASDQADQLHRPRDGPD